ncbi:hypothetical protein TWF694_011243 [Orbilia ellipsospora]|uniref:DUF1868 domain-containing protein n=1 Tax=Orbilia ellipsospora TaxID=2528407 RepID=A0AAV9X8Y2_9PEZI
MPLRSGNNGNNMVDLEKLSTTTTYHSASSRARGFAVLLLLIFSCFIHPILRSRDPLSFGLMVFPEPKPKTASHVAATAELLDEDREYAIAILDMIDINREVQPYAGCDVRFSVSNSSEFYESLLSLHGKLENHRLKRLYKLVPPTSWHITIFDILNDKDREEWPGYLDRDAAIDDIAKVLKNKISDVDIKLESPVAVTVTDFDWYQADGKWNEIGLVIAGRTQKEVALMEDLQERLSGRLGHQALLQDSLHLDLKIGYLVSEPDDAQGIELRTLLTDHFKGMPKEFELGKLALAQFENVFSAKTLMEIEGGDIKRTI